MPNLLWSSGPDPARLEEPQFLLPLFGHLFFTNKFYPLISFTQMNPRHTCSLSFYYQKGPWTSNNLKPKTCLGPESEVGYGPPSRVFQCHPGNNSEGLLRPQKLEAFTFIWASPTGRFPLQFTSHSSLPDITLSGPPGTRDKRERGTPAAGPGDTRGEGAGKTNMWGTQGGVEGNATLYRFLSQQKRPSSFPVWKTDSERELRATVQDSISSSQVDKSGL